MGGCVTSHCASAPRNCCIVHPPGAAPFPLPPEQRTQRSQRRHGRGISLALPPRPFAAPRRPRRGRRRESGALLTRTPGGDSSAGAALLLPPPPPSAAPRSQPIREVLRGRHGLREALLPARARDHRRRGPAQAAVHDAPAVRRHRRHGAALGRAHVSGGTAPRSRAAAGAPAKPPDRSAKNPGADPAARYQGYSPMDLVRARGNGWVGGGTRKERGQEGGEEGLARSGWGGWGAGA